MALIIPTAYKIKLVYLMIKSVVIVTCLVTTEVNMSFPGGQQLQLFQMTYSQQVTDALM